MDTILNTEPGYRAATLNERSSLICESKGNLTNTPEGMKSATQFLTEWKSQPPFNKADFFDQRLAISNISEKELKHIINQSNHHMNSYSLQEPDWWREIRETFSNSTSPDFIHSSYKQRSKKGIRGFLHLVEPLIIRGINKLCNTLEKDKSTNIDLFIDLEQCINLFLPALEKSLFQKISRTLVLELNVARVQKTLQGETKEERFSAFIALLKNPEYSLSLLQEYPVLARQLITTINQWVDSSYEFIFRLSKDWAVIKKEFLVSVDHGMITHVNYNLSDKHCNGKSVIIAKFDSGLQLVYKPKPLGIDVWFQGLLEWLNKKNIHLPFRTLKIIEKEGYGWTEFIEGCACKSINEVHNFYQRQGGYLALLYVLRGTDMHHENLIASGEHPILIDLETLFKPQIKSPDHNDANQIAINILGNSVLSTGMLPYPISLGNQAAALDLSGLGFKEGQYTPYDLPQLNQVGTDEMSFYQKPVIIPGSKNQPTIGNEKIAVDEHIEYLVKGFSDVYQLLMKHRSELLFHSGLLDSFKNTKIRIVLRSTRSYGMLLSESFHPNLLRDALHRDRFFDNLWNQVEHLPHLKNVINSEYQDLLRGDIPMFTTTPESTDLFSSDNDKVKCFFDTSGLTLVKDRITHLSKDDLEKQIWLMRASLIEHTNKTIHKKNIGVSQQKKKISQVRLLNAAKLIADRIGSLAIHSDSDVSWFGLTLTNKGRWMTAPLGPDLYEGIPGILFFLAYLGNLSGEKQYTSLAQKACTNFLRQIEQANSRIQTIGAFNGLGGIIYTLTHLAMLWKRNELTETATALIPFLNELIHKDENYDVIGGSAGAIMSLIGLHQSTPNENVLKTAIGCGNRLLDKAIVLNTGKGWVGNISSDQPLAGFSHGVSGIALALSRLNKYTKKKNKFIELSYDAIRYERSLFSDENKNWPDLRHIDTHFEKKDSKFLTSWCHGAPGIGISRIEMFNYFNNQATISEIKTACQTTITKGFGKNHSLCHGDLGNLELLLMAKNKMNMNNWDQESNHVIESVLSDIETRNWNCGHPKGVESVGLMTGLAGIGYAILRLAFSDQIPSILMLEAPYDKKVTHS